MSTLTTLKALLAQRILIIDGAMGTMIQRHQLEEADYRGERFADWAHDLKGNNDLLVLTQPQIIQDIHEAYLDAGADIIETNSFNGTRVSMSDYHMEDLVPEINREAARLAKAACEKYSTPDKPRFVAGVLGPTSRTCSISPNVNDPAFRNITFDALKENYIEAAHALIEGGADILLIETVFDTLNCKAAIFAVKEVFKQLGRELPLMISGTITDASGRTLTGQTAEAFWNSVRHGDLLSIGFNCALGADAMRPHVKTVSDVADVFVSAHPNAGLPNAFGGYDETPEETAAFLKEFAESGLINITGGCCGTTPDHIRAIYNAVKDIPPRKIPEIKPACRLSGLEPFNIYDDSLFVNVGERTNVTGSKKFLRLIREENFAEALDVARQQVESGAQIIDINMDEGMLDSEGAMVHFLNLVASEPDISRVPIMIDSSKWEIIEAGLKCVQGKAIVNSISLKEGYDEFVEKARLCRQYGAAVIVMAFDENGQADTAARKKEICKRSYDVLVNDVGFPAEDIIFDPNVFAVATGIEEHNNYAVDFIEATGWIKQNLPHAMISGGISNVSFSFRGNEPVREAIHAVFLYYAIKQGLTMGIVNAGQLAIYDDIDPELKDAVENVILNQNQGASGQDATEKLLEVAEKYRGQSGTQKAEENLEWRNESVEKRLTEVLLEKEQVADGSFNIEITPNFKKEEYKQAVDEMIRYIIEGDIYITNMTQQLEVKSNKKPLDVFYDLRENNPSPFGGYMDYGDFQIVCASPERFLKMKKGHVNTRPIKGTRKRGETLEEDLLMRNELKNSEKDKSELLMIVDLERNDLNRVCKPGSVKVTELFTVEEYATVFHLVSDIEGVLQENKTIMDLLEATFPGGSITGAPKYRAMEIIDELENNRRNLYTGSIGYLTLDGDCDFNIVIRTALHKDGMYYLGVGGGITAESDLEFEYEETLQKAKAVLEAMK